MRRKPNRIRNLALVALALMLVLPWGAAADNIVGEVVAEGGDTFEAGSSTTYRYKIVGTGGDGQPGCNCSDGTAVTVTIVTPANVTANPSSLTFTQCNVFQLVAFTASAAGNYDIAATWSDAGPGQYSTQPAEFTLHVLPGGADTTPPVVTCPEDITAEATGPEGAVVTFEATATDDVGVASIVATPPSGSTFPLGTTTVVVTATDTSGNWATCDFSVTVVDTTPPEVTCPDDITVFATGGSQAIVTFEASAYDLVSGEVPVVATPPSGSSFPVGTTVVTVTATDDAGNTGSCSFRVWVRYNWSGFFPPVDNLPTWNRVKAGSAVPVKFSLDGDQGLNVFAPGYPRSVTIPCDSTALVDAIEQTVTAGQSSLTYDPIADQYVYVWKTDKAWAGTCRQLVVMLADGTVHRANFTFTR